jgi:HK97 gp10 family phage protein
MAKGVTVKVEGLREVDAALGQLGKATGRNVMRRVAVARLQPIAEDMRDKAPVDQSDLRDSIIVTTKNPKRNRKRSQVEAHAGPGRHPQAHLQEFGTQHHGPQPFVRPAWDAGKDELLEGIADDLWTEIEKAAARQARKAARLAAKG